ncbi:TspO/MBR family protein [Haloprofundus marisrubri]|uniref:TspO/MBR family protein n=1 Tax=Haloprofundus marisrubri TaxID=1514971 RepID=UPI0009E61DF9|nr:TspO/MBR family protein [Haloprofundus marisrubri]
MALNTAVSALGLSADDRRGLAACIALCELAGVVPGALTREEIAEWYPTLERPESTPPGWVFAPVWTFLYATMGVALYLVFRDNAQSVRGRQALWAFVGQLLLNVSWTLVFFGRQSVLGGFVTIVGLWLSVLTTLVAFARVNRRAALLLLPYVLWVSFATLLNARLWRLNRS